MEDIILNRELFDKADDNIVDFRCTSSIYRSGISKNAYETVVCRGGCNYTLRKTDEPFFYDVLKTDDGAFHERIPDMRIKISDWELEESFIYLERNKKIEYVWSTDDEYINGNKADSIEACIEDAKSMYEIHDDMFDDEDVTVIEIGPCEYVDPRHAAAMMVETFKEKIDDYINDNYMCSDGFESSEMTDDEKLELFRILYKKAKEKAGHLFMSNTVIEYDLKENKIIKDWRKKE